VTLKRREEKKDGEVRANLLLQNKNWRKQHHQELLVYRALTLLMHSRLELILVIATTIYV